MLTAPWRCICEGARERGSTYLHLGGLPRVLDRLDLADVGDAPVEERAGLANKHAQRERRPVRLCSEGEREEGKTAEMSEQRQQLLGRVTPAKNQGTLVPACSGRQVKWDFGEILFSRHTGKRRLLPNLIRLVTAHHRNPKHICSQSQGWKLRPVTEASM